MFVQMLELEFKVSSDLSVWLNRVIILSVLSCLKVKTDYKPRCTTEEEEQTNVTLCYGLFKTIESRIYVTPLR